MPRRSKGDSKDSATKHTMNPPLQGGDVQAPKERFDGPTETGRDVGQFSEEGQPARMQK